MPINTANATWLSGDDVEPRLCDCPKFVPWHQGPAEYNLTTTNLLLPSHFEGVWGITPAAGGKQELSNSHYKPLGLKSKKRKWFSVVPRGLAGIHCPCHKINRFSGKARTRHLPLFCIFLIASHAGDITAAYSIVICVGLHRTLGISPQHGHLLGHRE